MIQNLDVYLWGRKAGSLVTYKERYAEKICFYFDPAFLSAGYDIAPLRASVNSTSVKNGLPVYADSEKLFGGLPSFIADSLPDHWGNKVFNEWAKAHNISTRNLSALDRLAYIGRRGMGALEFEPSIDRGYADAQIEIKALVDLAQRIFVEREKAVIEPEEELTLHSLIAVGTSVGGRQPKAIIAINCETKEIRSGQITDLEGYDYYILKFGDAERSSAELEMVYYEMCRLAGIDIMDSQLFDVAGNVHFLTKRFDRKNGQKLHVQTLAALCPEADSYEKLIAVCRKMNLGESVCEEIFRRMVFNVLANNTDDHNKNFSFIMNQNGEWRVAPAYDMTFIFNRGGFLPQMERCLMIRGKLQNITKSDILDFARDNAIRRPYRIINKVVFRYGYWCKTDSDTIVYHI